MSASGRTLPPFPTDDVTLHMLERAIDTTADARDNGEFTLPQLLDFLANYDPARSVDTGDRIDGIPVFDHPDQIYSESDVIRSLIATVRGLRANESEKL
ncbi:hypothetical protein CH305_18370 [Rhodococcus sp. 15-649-2-2]|uniref:hypothetical protein n=1 Tax=Rhodococcus sp. 15-649-2-2 TaxID=2023140 RepID=UPI000B9B4AA4|nr:hypothetical protein [Rhodococcus sp. 15-649-2-2]OZE77203.1 hypothetical protein CH305_18370 [Rhodococcus sp. 15-649-2-2]